MFTRFPLHDCALAIACRPGASPFGVFLSLLSLGFARGDAMRAVCALECAGAL